MKKIILFPSLAIAFAALAIVLVSEWTTAQEPAPVPTPSGPDIVAVITADPNLTTLVSALRAAELVEALQARGSSPYGRAKGRVTPWPHEDFLSPEIPPESRNKESEKRTVP